MWKQALFLRHDDAAYGRQLRASVIGHSNNTEIGLTAMLNLPPSDMPCHFGLRLQNLGGLDWVLEDKLTCLLRDRYQRQ